MDEEHDDFAAGLTQSLSKDGQTTPTAALPMAGFSHTGVGNATARNHYAAAGQVQDSSFIWCGTAGGTKNALTLTPSPAITAYAAGQLFRFKAGAAASDDAATVAISGLASPKAIELNNAALSAAVFIEANKYYEILYDGTAFQITRLSSGSLSRTGLDADIVTGTAGTDGNLAQWNADGDLVDGPDVLDEDDMSSNSAAAVPTQQSVKAYVDASAVVITDWVSYTPTFAGFGTATSVSIWSRRVGDTLHIRGRFTAGTVDGSEARMNLGFNGVDGVITSDATKVASLQIAGVLIRDTAGANSSYVLIESNVGYVTFGVQSSVAASMTKQTGTGTATSGQPVSVMAEVPISGW